MTELFDAPSDLIQKTLARAWTPTAGHCVFAAALLVEFHLASGGLDQPGRLISLIVVANGAIGLVLGWIYAVYGFEFVMLGHAVAHVITVVGG